MLRRGFLEQTAGRLSGQGCKILLDSFASSPRPVRFAEIPYTFRQRHTGESKLDAAVMLEYLALIGDKLLGAYWWCATEVIGLLLVPAVIGGPWLTFRRGFDGIESLGFVMLLSISLLYYAYLALFRAWTRFVLPVVPYLVMLAGPACARLRSSVRAVAPVLGLLLLYNAAYSAAVGSRFANDPRMAARSWLRANLPARSELVLSGSARQACARGQSRRLPGLQPVLREPQGGRGEPRNETVLHSVARTAARL